MSQVDVELRRFFARRMVRGLVLIAAFIVLLSVGIATAKGHRGHDLSFGPVVRDPATGRVSQPYGGDPFFTNRDTRIDIGKSLEHALDGTGIALLLAGFAVGASFVGAEFNVGSLTTQLLFEPRRWCVHVAKAIGVFLGAALTAFAILALVAISMYVGSEAHGIVQGVDGTFVVDRLGQAFRIAATIGAGAMLAYAVTLVAKRSSAGMIIFILQFPLLSLLDPTKMPFGLISHYAPLRALLAVLVNPSNGSGVQDRAIHTTAGGLVLTAVWIVVIVGGSGLLFERAEVR